MSEHLLFRWRWAICGSNLPASTRHLLHVLGFMMETDGSGCRVSTRKLSKLTGMARSTIHSHLAAVEGTWLRVQRDQSSAGDSDVNQYGPVIPDQVVRESDHPVGRDSDQGGPGVGPGVVRQPDTTSTQTSTSTSTETLVACDVDVMTVTDSRRSRTFPPVEKLPKRGRDRIYPPEFEGAFSAMPRRHVAHPKADAYRAWRARTGDVAEAFQLEAAADAYAEDVRAQEQEGSRYVMQASTFFGPGDRWRPYTGRQPGALRAAIGGGHATAEQEEEARRRSFERDRQRSDPDVRPEDDRVHRQAHAREFAEASQLLAAAGEDATDRVNRLVTAECQRCFRGREAPQQFQESQLVQAVRQELGPLPSDRKRGGEHHQRGDARRPRRIVVER